MTLDDYNVLAVRTLNDLGRFKNNLVHMALGITGEAGEVADVIKKHYAYGKALDVQHLVEEVGDIMFYLNGLLAEVDVEWSEVLDLNIKKLEARYPDLRFNADHAINRDVNAEQKAMFAKALNEGNESTNHSWVDAEDEAASMSTGAPL